GYLVGLIEVVRSHAALEEFLEERLHDLRIVVDTAKEHGLAAEWAAGVSEQSERLPSTRRQFVRMIEVNVHEYRVIFLDRLAQLRGDPFGKLRWYPGVNAKDLHMRNRSERLQEVFDSAVGQHEWITAGKNDIANLCVFADVFECRLELVEGNLLRVTDLSPP